MTTNAPMITVIAVRPAEDDGKSDGRRVQADTGRQAALNQKDGAGERARFRVEALLQIFISRIDLARDERSARRWRDRMTIAIGSPK